MKLQNALIWSGVALAVQCAAAGEEAEPYTRVSRDAFEARLPFFAYEPDIPHEGRVVWEEPTAYGARSKVVYRGAQGFLVPAYLQIPADAATPCPLVVLLHGWSGGKEDWWTADAYISGSEMRTALLEAGYAVFAFDAAAHGERSAEIDYMNVNAHDDPAAPKRRNYFTIAETVTQTVKDCRRALGYLADRGDLDMTRVGLLGYSMGGVETMLLLSMDDRFKMGVACVPPFSVRDWKPVDPVDYTWGLGDTPLLMLMGRQDTLYSEAPTTASFKAYFNPETTRMIWYDRDHQLTPIYVPDALAWIKDKL